jgi:hypothetical protein
MERVVSGGKEVEEIMMMMMMMMMLRESVSGKQLNFKHQKWMSD